MENNLTNTRTKYKYTMDNVFSSRVSGGLGWHSYYKPNIMRIVDKIEDMQKLKHTWIQDIDNHPNSTIFHTWEWVMNCIENGLHRYYGCGPWAIYISFDENNKINFMMPTYECYDGDPCSKSHSPWTGSNKVAYLGMLYSDYTDPFCTYDDYWEFMNNSVIVGKGPLKQMPNIRFPKGHRVSDEFSNVCLYSYDSSDMKSKFIKDLRRQKKKVPNYSIFIDKGNKLNLWEKHFYNFWNEKWSESWGSKDSESFHAFVKDNKALNAGVLYIEDEPAAINLHLIHNGVCLFWVISRNPHIKFSAGSYLWYELMKTYEHDDKISKFSGGIGIEPYKYNFFKKEEQLYASDWTNT